MTGLQLLGVVLSCGALAYDPIRDIDISEFRFFEQLLSNLNIPTKPIYRATAEVCGLALKQAAEKGGSTSVDYKVHYTTQHNTTQLICFLAELTRLARRGTWVGL